MGVMALDHLRDQSCTVEPEESTVMVATFALLVDATHGKKNN